MSAEDAFDLVELAMDDHYTAAELKDQYEDDLVDQAYEARDKALDLADNYGDVLEATETEARAVAEYLMNHRDHMDDRAIELSNAADEIEDDLDNLDEPDVDTGNLLDMANRLSDKVENEYTFNF